MRPRRDTVPAVAREGRRARRMVGRVVGAAGAVVGLVVAVLGAGVGTSPAAGAASAGQGLPSWQVAATLALGTDHAAVDCPTTTACWALESGHLLSSTDAGRSWTDRTALVPDGVTSLVDVDCPAAQRCVLAASDASGAALAVFVAGTAVTSRPVPAAAFTSLSCVSARHCVGVTGGSSFATTDAGVTWTQGYLGRTLLGAPAVDCVAGTSVCYAAGN